MRIPPLLADFIYSSDCKLICEKSLTLPILLDNLFLLVYHVTGNLEQIVC